MGRYRIQARRQTAINNAPGVLTDEWEDDDKHTVASYPGNEPYPDDALIAIVVFPDEIDAHGMAVNERPLKLTALASQGVSYFAFPTPTLKIVGDGDGAAVAHVPPEAWNPSLTTIGRSSVHREVHLSDHTDPNRGADILACRRQGISLEIKKGDLRRGRLATISRLYQLTGTNLRSTRLRPA